MHTFRLLFVCVFLSASSCAEKVAKENYDLKIQNVSIIDENGELWKGTHTVFTKDKSIKAIEQQSESTGALATQKIDGTNKFLLLGLWDNHAHFRGGESLISQNEKFLQLFTDYGITTVRDAGGDLTPQIQKWNNQIQNQEKIGPTIFTSGPKLDGPNARWAGSLPITSVETIDLALDSLQQLGVDYVKLYDSTISGENYLEIIRRAEARGMITSGHMPFTVELDKAITAGLDNVEHLYYILKGCSSQEATITQKIQEGTLGFWGSMEQLIDTYDEKTAQNTFKRLKENEVYVTPTLYIGQTLSYLDEVDHTKDPYLQNLSQDFINTYEGRNRGALGGSPEARARRKTLQAFFLKLTKSLSDSGVQLLAGSDSGAYNSYTYPGISLHKELQEMVKAGLSTQEALRNSYNGARFFKLEKYTMKVGSQADLLLLNSNPLEDIKNTLDTHSIIKGGVVLE